MKKTILTIMTFLLLSPVVFAETENLIIPQKDSIYSDLSMLAENGLIKSVSPDYFTKNAITKYEAAAFIKEAGSFLSAGAVAQGDSNNRTSKMLEAYAIKYSVEISGLRNFAAAAGQDAVEADPFGQMRAELDGLERNFSATRFTDATPFKITGVIAARFMNINTFGASEVNRSSFATSNLALYAGAALTDKIRMETNLTFEVPQFDPEYIDPVNAALYTSLNGVTKPVWIDVYTLTFDIYGFKVVTGFFWEDITSFIASQGQSERIGIFERDKYAGEETTKSHFETVFRNFSQNRDQRWSKHAWNGIDIYKDGIIGRDILKIAAGKPQETFGKNEYYEYAARYTHFQNLPFAKQGEISMNIYNRSNDIRELIPFSTQEPASQVNNISIYGGDLKAVLFGAFKIKAEYERSTYKGVLSVASGQAVPSFYQEGNAIFGSVAPSFLPKGVDLVLKYTRIDPGYVAPASAVADNNYRAINISDTSKVDIISVTYAGDPTALYNNMNKIEAHAFFNVPFGILMVNYGISSQIQKTGPVFQTSHWLIGTEWGRAFTSNYGWADGLQHAGFIAYNQNRYGIDVAGSSTFPKGAPDAIIAGGKGGMTTLGANREYMVSTMPGGETNKYLSNVMMLLRVELNRLVKLNSPLMLELYGEIIKLSNLVDFLASYDPDQLLAQNMLSACLIYNIMPKMSVIGFAGMERWGSNNVLPLPVDYMDTAFGLGLDYDLAGRAFLYLRLKNFYHSDREVPENNMRGFSVWAELKSFF